MTSTDVGRTAAVSYRSLLADPRLLTVVLLSMVGTMGVNVAAPALPAMGPALGVSDASLGLVVSAYTLTAMVVVPLAGVLADLYGRRRVVIPALVLFGVTGSAIALVDSFAAVLALRALQGVGFAGIMPLSVTILGDLYDGPRGSAAQGVRVSVNGLSSVVVPAIAGALSALAWNYPFLVYAIVLPIAAIAYVALPETAAAGAVEDGVVVELRRYAGAIRAELRQVRVATLVSGGGVRDFVRFGIITFVPIFAVRSLDASFVQAGALLSARGAAAIVVAPLAGSIVAALSRRWALVGALLIGAASTALVTVAPDVYWLGAVVLLYSVGDAVFSPVIKGAVTDAAPEASRAGIVSGMNVLKFGAQAAAPAFFGLVLAAAGFDWLFLVATGILLGYAALVAGVLE